MSSSFTREQGDTRWFQYHNPNTTALLVVGFTVCVLWLLVLTRRDGGGFTTAGGDWRSPATWLGTDTGSGGGSTTWRCRGVQLDLDDILTRATQIVQQAPAGSVWSGRHERLAMSRRTVRRMLMGELVGEPPGTEWCNQAHETQGLLPRVFFSDAETASVAVAALLIAVTDADGHRRAILRLQSHPNMRVADAARKLSAYAVS